MKWKNISTSSNSYLYFSKLNNLKQNFTGMTEVEQIKILLGVGTDRSTG